MPPLIDDVFGVCQRLNDQWAKLLSAHGLQIRQADSAALANELANTVLHVNRSVRGFSDFADDVARGIVPRKPANSLLYHALASPNVQTALDGSSLSQFPTLDDIETVENYVFGVQPPTLDELKAEVGGGELEAVVFAYEYRPATQTCHRKHADLTFARTGSARVGTQSARYMPGLRGYVPESDDDPFAIHVSPARYGVFLSVQKPGDATKFRPMRIQPGDDALNFWIPVHKLFSGADCLKGLGAGGLTIDWTAQHINEKILRLHRALGNTPPDAPPFRVRNGLAKIVPSPGGSVAVFPEPHPLVEPARTEDGKLVTFTVPGTFNSGGPGGNFSTLSTSLAFADSSAPSYAHVRTEILNGKMLDLNQDDPSLNKSDDQLLNKIVLGGYEALNYSDFTAEGWVTATVHGSGALAIASNARAAYSLVSAPDFYPACDQRELTEWTGSSSVPQKLQSQIWSQPPKTLCDKRLPANLQIGAPFTADETTVTALVSLLSSTPQGAALAAPAAARHSHLPDDCAGVFAPGWDVSVDTVDGVDHLAGYPLGSPFPEDAKLCAALSTFWPAVAPDATREMQPPTGNQSGTVSPMTDEEVGTIGGMPWDGVPGPAVVNVGGQRFADFASFNRVDYVRNALAGRFTMRLTARVDATEYQQRVLVLALMYAALHAERVGMQLPPGGLRNERKQWFLLSFRTVSQGDPELTEAQQDAGLILPGPVYRAVFFPPAPLQPAPDFRRKRIHLADEVFLLGDPINQRVLVRGEGESLWRRGLL